MYDVCRGCIPPNSFDRRFIAGEEMSRPLWLSRTNPVRTNSEGAYTATERQNDLAIADTPLIWAVFTSYLRIIPQNLYRKSTGVKCSDDVRCRFDIVSNDGVDANGDTLCKIISVSTSSARNGSNLSSSRGPTIAMLLVNRLCDACDDRYESCVEIDG